MGWGGEPARAADIPLITTQGLPAGVLVGRWPDSKFTRKGPGGMTAEQGNGRMMTLRPGVGHALPTTAVAGVSRPNRLTYVTARRAGDGQALRIMMTLAGVRATVSQTLLSAIS